MELASKSVGHTPVSSPGLFAPATPSSSSATSTEGAVYSSPAFLHWTQKQQPKETHIADKDIDPISGRKLLNQYEIIDELGRGVHGKVKLGRNLDKGNEVAIKIVARYSKRRRLGKLGNPEDKVKKEVAILKKAIHPNVVALLEVIDDPAIMKVYIVLEFVELGEIVWRTKGAREIVWIERRRMERQSRGQFDPALEQEDLRIFHEMEARNKAEQAELQQRQARATEFWSLEHGGESDYEESVRPRLRQRVDTNRSSMSDDPASSTFPTHPGAERPSRSLWTPTSPLHGPRHQSNGDIGDRIPLPAPRSHSSLPTLESSYPSTNEHLPTTRSASPRTPADLFTYMTDEDPRYDAFAEDSSYVPCLTLEQARQAFRDTILGVEYLHYQGIVHRDIKPANLLWTAEHRVKISDFGVSYLGRPIRDDDLIEDVAEVDAQPLDEAVELAKTVGTPAFYAPELCYTDLSAPRPPVTGQIDLWALGVTLYCLLFARLPFRAEDEFQLFKSISEDEVFIPRKRLKAVDPGLSSKSSSYPRLAQGPAPGLRLAHELVYEEIDDDLYDLLKRILEKNPSKRITLREVKRHPFTLKGIADPIRWIDETDPTRQNEGRKIEVSTEDVEKAVVSIGFLERVRSGMRKVGQAIGFGKAREGRRRIRGNDSTTESGSDSLSPTPTLKEGRRQSLRGDELLHTPTARVPHGEHPLSQSVTASPEAADKGPFFQDVTSHPAGWPASAGSSPVAHDAGEFLRMTSLERTPSNSAASMRTVVAYEPGDSASHVSPLISPGLPSHPTALEGPGSANLGGIFGGADGLPIRRKPSRTLTDLGLAARHEPRAASMSRIDFDADGARVEPSVAISNTVASGFVDAPPPHSDGPVLASSEFANPAVSETSPAMTSPHLLKSFLAGSVEGGRPPGPTIAPGRPTTAPPQRRSSMARSDADSPSGATYESTDESFARAQEQLFRRRGLETEQAKERQAQIDEVRSDAAFRRSCPPSPDDEDFHRRRQEERDARRAGDVTQTPPQVDTRPPFTASPSHHPMISSSSDDHITSGMSQSTSYPSVPSVISAGSSISTDDLGLHPLSKKDVRPAILRAEEAITPPSQVSSQGSMTMPSDDDAGYIGDHGDESGDDEEDDDSEGDDFLVMTRRRSRSNRAGGPVKPAPPIIRHPTSSTMRTTRSGSTGTLKKTSSREEGDTTASESKTPRYGEGKPTTSPDVHTPDQEVEREVALPIVAPKSMMKEDARPAIPSDAKPATHETVESMPEPDAVPLAHNTEVPNTAAEAAALRHEEAHGSPAKPPTLEPEVHPNPSSEPSPSPLQSDPLFHPPRPDTATTTTAPSSQS